MGFEKIGNGSIPLRIGNLINTTVYGGPYLDVPIGFYGVKMAEEITHPHMVSVPTRDFSVPKVSDLQAGIIKALMGMINEEEVYVGCMGGYGRTGIFLAALAKVQIEYRKFKHRPGRGVDPVMYVRNEYCGHAVETKEQEQFIEDFDVSGIINWLDTTQIVMGLGGMTPAIETGNVPKQAVDFDNRHPHGNIPRDEDDRSNKGLHMPIYDEHENIPVDYLQGNVKFRYERHRAQWKKWRQENAAEAAEGLPELDEHGYPDIDSTNPDDLQTQMWKLEERLVSLEQKHDHNVTSLAENIDTRFDAVKDLFIQHFGKPEKKEDLTKTSIHERIQDKVKR